MHHTVTPRWHQSNAKLYLLAGRVDVWRIDLDQARATLRVTRGPAACSPTRRSAARQVVLDILAAYLGETAEPPQIALHPGGKPYLAHPSSAIAFNLSHAQGLGLLAVSRDCDLGVDVELPRRINDPLRLAERALSAAEVAYLRGLADGRRNAGFLDLWTRMEARQKALGRGAFAEPVDPKKLSSVSFQPGPGQFACVSVRPQREFTLRFFDYRAQ